VVVGQEDAVHGPRLDGVEEGAGRPAGRVRRLRAVSSLTGALGTLTLTCHHPAACTARSVLCALRSACTRRITSCDPLAARRACCTLRRALVRARRTPCRIFSEGGAHWPARAQRAEGAAVGLLLLLVVARPAVHGPLRSAAAGRRPAWPGSGDAARAPGRACWASLLLLWAAAAAGRVQLKPLRP